MSEILTVEQLEEKTLKEIYAYAKELKIPYYSQMNKKELALAVIRAQEEKQGFFIAEGVLDIMAQQDFGFLRPINYTSSKEDVYISASQIKRFGLRNGDKVTGKARPPKPSERYYGLMHVSKVNGSDPEQAKERSHFPALTPLYPNRQIKLETGQSNISARMIDIVAPVGFGQRGLIVAPPKAGKTTLLKEIANGIAENYPEAELIVLLIDERPEEVTDIERSVKGEVVSSTFDQQPQNHVRVAELVLERAMRLVEDKQDVIILMDSITRLARAYNLVIPASGRTLSGGIDPAALYRPKKFFGAARNIEEGGSLTILATALVETGSRMDDIIYEEFKGTGNSELHLSRELSERRIYPAIDVKKSSTRKEELLLNQIHLDEIWKLRHAMISDSLELTDQFIKALRNSENNQQFFESFSEKAFSQKKTGRNLRR
ncbi:MAG: transcription termination factor Rho [Carnobacterium sp.]|uniref:transcription termination factor Rho n=1 Tax=Carnobacterium sp. TaxID=48221 RepID=UPI003C74A4CC